MAATTEPLVPSTTADLEVALGGQISTGTAVTEVTRRLLDYFTGGTIEQGSRLPPERQLAASLGVGRSAVREALAALEILGVVTVRPGSGTYLRGAVSELLPQTLSWGMLIGPAKTKELLDVRHGLEVQAARLAADHITDDELDQLASHLTTMDAASKASDFDGFVAADVHFHHEIAEASRSELLCDMLSSVRSLLRVWAERALNATEHADRATHEHHEILDALRARDSEASAAAMNHHMETATRRLLA